MHDGPAEQRTGADETEDLPWSGHHEESDYCDDGQECEGCFHLVLG
jgi:hypothetical protein